MCIVLLQVGVSVKALMEQYTSTEAKHKQVIALSSHPSYSHVTHLLRASHGQGLSKLRCIAPEFTALSVVTSCSEDCRACCAGSSHFPCSCALLLSYGCTLILTLLLSPHLAECLACLMPLSSCSS